MQARYTLFEISKKYLGNPSVKDNYQFDLDLLEGALSNGIWYSNIDENSSDAVDKKVAEPLCNITNDNIYLVIEFLLYKNMMTVYSCQIVGSLSSMTPSKPFIINTNSITKNIFQWICNQDDEACMIAEKFGQQSQNSFSTNFNKDKEKEIVPSRQVHYTFFTVPRQKLGNPLLRNNYQFDTDLLEEALKAGTWYSNIEENSANEVENKVGKPLAELTIYGINLIIEYTKDENVMTVRSCQVMGLNINKQIAKPFTINLHEQQVDFFGWIYEYGCSEYDNAKNLWEQGVKHQKENASSSKSVANSTSSTKGKEKEREIMPSKQMRYTLFNVPRQKLGNPLLLNNYQFDIKLLEEALNIGVWYSNIEEKSAGEVNSKVAKPLLELTINGVNLIIEYTKDKNVMTVHSCEVVGININKRVEKPFIINLHEQQVDFFGWIYEYGSSEYNNAKNIWEQDVKHQKEVFLRPILKSDHTDVTNSDPSESTGTKPANENETRTVIKIGQSDALPKSSFFNAGSRQTNQRRQINKGITDFKNEDVSSSPCVLS